MIRRYGYPFERQDADPDPNRAFHCGYRFKTHRLPVMLQIMGNAVGHGSRVITEVEEVNAKGMEG